MGRVKLKITGQDFFDFFEDEEIEYTRKVIDFENTDTTYGDSSQPFSLPATNFNNKVFQHYYDLRVLNGFNPFQKIEAELWLNDERYSTGSIQLLKVSMKGNRPSSYSIQYYSTVINLKEALKDKTLADLDWSDLTHSLSINDALEYLSGTEVLGMRYPMASVANYWTFNYDFPESESPEGQRAIALTDDCVLNREIRPAIKWSEVIRRIFLQSGFNYNIDFETEKLYELGYMWVDNGAEFEETPQTCLYYLGTETLANYLGTPLIWSNKQEDTNNIMNRITGEFTILVTGSYNVDVELYTESLAGSVGLSVQVKLGTVVTSYPYTSGGINIVLGVLSAGTVLQLLVRTEINPPTGVNAPPMTIGSASSFSLNSSVVSQTDQMIVQRYMPKVKCIDFLQGFANTLGANIIYNEKLNRFDIVKRVDWLSSGKVVDLSNFVDIESWNVQPSTYFKTYSYKFTDGKDWANELYELENDRPWGSTFIDTGNYFGTDYTFESVFTASVFKEIHTWATNGSIIYSSGVPSMQLVDLSRKKIKGGTRIMFYIGQSTFASGGQYGVADIDGVKTSLGKVTCNNFQSLAGQNSVTDVSFSYSAERGWPTVGAGIRPTTLYSSFFALINQKLYNQDVRKVKYEGFLPYDLQKELELNDTVLISGVYFYIDTLKINLVTQRFTIELISITGGLSI